MRTTLFLFLTFLLTATSCSTCSRNSIADKMQNAIDSLKAGMDEQMKRDSMRVVRMDELRHQIDSIKAKSYTSNGYSLNQDVLVHYTWSSTLDLNRNGLMVVVDEKTGNVIVLSTLPGSVQSHPEQSRRVHSKVEIEIAGKSYVADSNHTTALTVADNGAYTAVRDAKGEVLRIDDDQSLEFVRAITANPSAEVKVTTYVSDTESSSYTLSEEDRNAIIEAYRLSLLIQELQELEAQDVEWDD